MEPGNDSFGRYPCTWIPGTASLRNLKKTSVPFPRDCECNCKMMDCFCQLKQCAYIITYNYTAYQPIKGPVV